MKITTDHRTIEWEPAPEAKARALERIRAILDLEIGLAKDLGEIDRKRAYVEDGCASVGEWAADHGGDATRARELARLGRAFVHVPALEERVANRTLRMTYAVVVSRVLCDPKHVRPGEDWLATAQEVSLRTLKQRVAARLEEENNGEPFPSMIQVPATEKMVQNFERLRVVYSQSASRPYSRSQALARAIEEALDRHDPTRTEGRARRVPPTRERPNDRYRPAEVDRAIQNRSGGYCEVGDCTNIATEFAHVRPHSRGSPREVRDLFGACHRHHVLYDSGYLRLEGWSSEGRPVFVKCVPRGGRRRAEGEGPPPGRPSAPGPPEGSEKQPPPG